MPLFRQWKERDAVWGIWQVTETPDELRSVLTASLPYDDDLSRMRAESRRLEYLAVRVLLKTIVGAERLVGHLPSGKPYLADDSRHISISHTRGYVAVGLHPSAEVGIDIEQTGERVRRVSSRFVRPDECPDLESLSSDEQLYQLLLHWSAKETLFKVMGCSDVDFLDHLRIFPFVLGSEGTFRAQEYRTSLRQLFTVAYLLHSDFVCTMTVRGDADRRQLSVCGEVPGGSDGKK